jgi:ribosomal protein S18 acetylase RimI-like enzyme
MEIRRAVEFSDNIREKISGIFVEAFGKDLKFFSKDRNRMVKAFSHIFVLDYFYVAVIDKQVAGMVVCIDKERYCINHNEKIFREYLGIYKGVAADIAFKYYFNKYPKYPIEIDSKTGSVEFVATKAEYRKMGVASAIINHIFTFPEYNSYILEVADTNATALRLYEKLGFKEVYRKRLRFGKQIGINYLLYMKRTK